MTNPMAPAPHQDPSPRESTSISIIEHVTTVIATLDRRFDTLHQDLKDSVSDRFDSVGSQLAEADLRYQQRYDAQQVALKDALTGQDKAVSAALIAAEKAVTKAENAAEKRFDSVNEFRAQLADQAGTFLPRAEAETQFRAIAEKIDDLKAYQASMLGREAASPSTPKQIQDLVDQVRALRDSGEQLRGRGVGLNAGWGYLISGVGLIVVVTNVIIALATR